MVAVARRAGLDLNLEVCSAAVAKAVSLPPVLVFVGIFGVPLLFCLILLGKLVWGCFGLIVGACCRWMKVQVVGRFWDGAEDLQAAAFADCRLRIARLLLGGLEVARFEAEVGPDLLDDRGDFSRIANGQEIEFGGVVVVETEADGARFADAGAGSGKRSQSTSDN